MAKIIVYSKKKRGHAMSIDSKSFKPIRKAVFPVAGLGTRFLPATKVMPKEMLTLGDKPLIQHAYEEAIDAGIEEIILVTGRQKEMLEEHFDYQPELMNTLTKRGKTDLIDSIKHTHPKEGQLITTRQPEALGLGHAIWCAKNLVGNEPFAVILPDDVVLAPKGCLSQLIEAYNNTGGNLVAVNDIPAELTYKYGILDIDTDNGTLVSIKGLIEKPEPENAPSNLSIIGRYILQPEIFTYLERFEKGIGGEIQLTDAMAKLIGKQPFHGVRFDGIRYDCGHRLGFIEANIAYGLADKNISEDIRTLLEKYLQDEKNAEKPNAIAR